MRRGPGDLYGMVPRARLCLLSPRCERRSLPQERNIPRPVPVPAAAVTSPPLALRETASGPPPLKGRQDRLPFRGAGAKRLRGPPPPPQRAILHLSTYSPFASAIRSLVPSPPAGLFLCSAQRKRRKKCAKGNLSRRRFPLESFPIGQGAAAPLRSPGVRGGRETEDERRKTRDDGRGTRDGGRGTGDEGRGFGREERIATAPAGLRKDGGWGGPPFALPCCQEME